MILNVSDIMHKWIVHKQEKEQKLKQSTEDILEWHITATIYCEEFRIRIIKCGMWAVRLHVSSTQLAKIIIAAIWKQKKTSINYDHFKVIVMRNMQYIISIGTLIQDTSLYWTGKSWHCVHKVRNRYTANYRNWILISHEGMLQNNV